MSDLLFPHRCVSPSCQAQGNADEVFYLPGQRDSNGISVGGMCLRCGSGSYLQKVEIVHFLVHDEHGLVRGSDWGRFRGTRANRYSPACERGKKVVAGGQHLRHQTVLPEAVTCNECLAFVLEAQHVGHADKGLWLPAGQDEIID